MCISLQELKEAASALCLGERAELAQFLLHSLDEGEEVEATQQWLALAEQRMAQIKAGKVVGVPAEEVLDSLPRPKP